MWSWCVINIVLRCLHAILKEVIRAVVEDGFDDIHEDAIECSNDDGEEKLDNVSDLEHGGYYSLQKEVERKKESYWITIEHLTKDIIVHRKC